MGGRGIYFLPNYFLNFSPNEALSNYNEKLLTSIADKKEKKKNPHRREIMKESKYKKSIVLLVYFSEKKYRIKIVNNCSRTNSLLKNSPKGNWYPRAKQGGKALCGMAAIQRNCQGLFSVLSAISLYLSYRMRKDHAFSQRQVGKENSLSIPRTSLKFALEHGNKEPVSLANKVDLALLCLQFSSIYEFIGFS